MRTPPPTCRDLWRAGCVEEAHVRFGRRAGETHRWKHRQGAPVRPHPSRVWDDAIGRLIFGWQPGGHRLIAVLPGHGQTIQVASWQPGQARLWVATARIPPGTSAVLGEYR